MLNLSLLKFNYFNIKISQLIKFFFNYWPYTPPKLIIRSVMFHSFSFLIILTMYIKVLNLDIIFFYLINLA